MRYFTTILFLIGISHAVFSQKIKRDRHLQRVLDSTQLSLAQNTDIFEDYGWLQPNVGSVPIQFDQGAASFNMNGKAVSASLADDGSIQLTAGGNEIAASSEKCKNCYYDISILQLKPVTTTRWVPVTSYQMQMVPVMRTRMVTRYQYNSSTGSSQPVYSSETYTAYESRSVPTTTYQYQTTTTFVLDIPVTTVYRFKDVFAENDQLLIYEVGDNDKKYYAQMASYLLAKTEDDINYIFIDVNGNGVFLEPADKVAFNTWNPFSKGSKFRPMFHFKENRWYSISELSDSYFIGFERMGEKHVFTTNKNNMFKDVKGYGKLHVKGVSEDCILEVNKRKYKKLTKPLKIEYGCYSFKLKREGYLDMVQTGCITKDSPEYMLNYESTETGKELTINNIFSTNYFITVKGENGYETNYYNQKSFQVPEGHVSISIDNSGYVLEQEFDTDTVSTLEIDYESEIKKLLPQDEEKEEDSGSSGKRSKKEQSEKGEAKETEEE